MKLKVFKKKSQRAFTLVELLLAVFVLEIGLLGVAGFYAQSLQITKTARNMTLASNLAQGLIDEQSAINFDGLTVGEGTPIAYTSEAGSNFTNFLKKVDIAYIDKDLNASYSQTEANENMKKITVTVYWQEGSSEKNYQMATIKAKH